MLLRSRFEPCSALKNIPFHYATSRSIGSVATEAGAGYADVATGKGGESHEKPEAADTEEDYGVQTKGTDGAEAVADPTSETTGGIRIQMAAAFRLSRKIGWKRDAAFDQPSFEVAYFVQETETKHGAE